MAICPVFGLSPSFPYEPDGDAHEDGNDDDDEKILVVLWRVVIAFDLLPSISASFIIRLPDAGNSLQLFYLCSRVDHTVVVSKLIFQLTHPW